MLWDRRTGQPVHRAIVWQDRRTAEHCAALRAAGAEDLLRRKTGLVLDPYFSATKLRWLLDHVRRAGERAARGELCFGTIDSWLVWKLTGGAVHVTDPTNASRTLLFDIHAQRWDPELCRLFDVPDAVLPEVRPSSGVFGETTPDVLGVPVPIAGIAGDQQAALFGQGCFAPGMAKNTYGTGCFLLMHTGAASRSTPRTGCSPPSPATSAAARRTRSRARSSSPAPRSSGCATGSGSSKTAAESERLARSVDDSLGVYVVPAFVGLGAPYWDAEARGAILGLTRGVTRAHLVRAALESLAYQTRDVVDAMAADAGAPLGELRVDGGAAANDFLMQFQADMLGVPVERPELVETTALGRGAARRPGGRVLELARELAATAAQGPALPAAHGGRAARERSTGAGRTPCAACGAARGPASGRVRIAPAGPACYNPPSRHEGRHSSDVREVHHRLRLRQCHRDPLDRAESIHVEICSACHPFFTGKQKLMDTAGRVERFNRKYGKQEPRRRDGAAGRRAARLTRPGGGLSLPLRA